MSNNETSKTSPKESGPSADGYNAVVAAASLEEIVLTESVFRIEPEYFSDNEDRQLLFEHEKTLHPYDKETSAISLEIKFSVRAARGESTLLECAAKYYVVFTVANEVDDAAVEAFLDRVGIFTAYPYFRARLAQYSWEAGAALPVLPIIKAPPRKAPTKVEDAVPPGSDERDVEV